MLGAVLTVLEANSAQASGHATETMRSEVDQGGEPSGTRLRRPRRERNPEPARRPEAPPTEPAGDLSDLNLGELLELDMGSGGLGSFGRRLKRLNIQASIHGYVTFDAVLFDPFDFDLGDETPLTFDIHYFNVFVGASMADRVYAEIQLEHEHGEDFAVRFAQLDLRLADFAVIRAGMFLTPFGRYNESLYPEYLTVLPRGPVVQMMRYIVPVVWNEVGVQLRGDFDLGELQLGYMVYVVNGLEQEDDEATPEVEDAGSLRAMRGNFRDRNNSDKAVGTRIYLRRLGAFEVGASGYTGAYTEDGEQRLTAVNLDAELAWSRLLVRSEGALVWQTSVGGTLRRWGAYTRVAYQASPHIRPAVGFDISRVEGGETVPEARWQVVGGVDYWPWPETLPTTIVRVAVSRQFEDLNDDGADDARNDIAMLQLTTGF